jgi:S-adenosylmethionine:tRNA ribosyltransferase-isomerase
MTPSSLGSLGTLHPVFDALEFVVPPELEASGPPEARRVARDQVRMLVSRLDRGEIVHGRFPQLPLFLRAGDLLVVNESATIPAALRARTSGGDLIALHVSTRLPAGLWIVEPREANVQRGDELVLPGDGRAQLFAPLAGSKRLWVAALDLPLEPMAYFARWGKPIAYKYVRGEWPIEAYQTIFAATPGSAEMPSAGRPFTKDVVRAVRERGVEIARILLHTGVASPERDEPPGEEYFSVPVETVQAVRSAKADGGRVIAVGTTVVRALESALDGSGRIVATQGWTDLVITPARGVRVVDGLLTGLHEPRSTHLAMLEAIAGPNAVSVAYRAALDAGYLWHEFGDVHLIV